MMVAGLHLGSRGRNQGSECSRHIYRVDAWTHAHDAYTRVTYSQRSRIGSRICETFVKLDSADFQSDYLGGGEAFSRAHKSRINHATGRTHVGAHARESKKTVAARPLKRSAGNLAACLCRAECLEFRLIYANRSGRDRRQPRGHHPWRKICPRSEETFANAKAVSLCRDVISGSGRVII